MFVLAALLFLTPFVVAAQSANPCTGGTDGDIGRCVSQIYVWSLGLSSLLAIIVVIVGGYFVMTARGNAAQASKGKSYIYSALVGLILLFGAYIILNTINSDLVDFDVDESLRQLPTDRTLPRQ